MYEIRVETKDSKMHTTFQELIAPLNKFFDTQSAHIDAHCGSKKLFFADFSKKLIYAFLMNIPSLRQLTTELQTSSSAAQLGLSPTAFSTLKDGFNRFAMIYFQQLYQSVLQGCTWLRIDALDELGVFRAIDGSIFPTLSSMDWAQYKKHSKALRLHLSFELNRMLPVEFMGLKANSCERSFLVGHLQKGITYIADRGYFSFKVAHKIETAKAFFILRIKNNLKIAQAIQLPLTHTKAGGFPLCFQELSDSLVRFESDKHEHFYRLIRFVVQDSEFLICTNRIDLTTLQIIILYAYRWQIELLFKFIKRTLKGIHLFNHSPNGVNIQFHILMIVALLQLRLKQTCIRLVENPKNTQGNPKSLEQIPTHLGYSPDCWIESLTSCLKKYWKICVHWIRKLQNRITHPFDSQTVKMLT